MYRRTSIVVAMVALAAPMAAAQDYVLPYLRKLETTDDFWAAARYEIDLGNYVRAGKMLAGFWESLTKLDPEQQDDVLLRLHDRVGLSFFLRLANVPEIRAARVKMADGKKEMPAIDALLERLNRALAKRYTDVQRLDFFIGRLGQSPEERAYAIHQLRLAGAAAVPRLVAVLRNVHRKADHPHVIYALEQIGDEGRLALLAALDGRSPANWRSTLLDIFIKTNDRRVIPWLWYFYGHADMPPTLRARAAKELARFLGRPVEQLGDARRALTEEAERYYRHQAPVPTGAALAIFTFDEQEGLSMRPSSPSEFEEHYGVFWAHKALELDRGYLPAQVVLWSLRLGKALERTGVQQPLAKSHEDLYQRLTALPLEVLTTMLDRALRERRTAVALGTLQVLAPLGDRRLLHGCDSGAAPVVRALSYPDRRVQLAAAETLALMPPATGLPGGGRLLDILVRAIRSDGPARALVACYDNQLAAIYLDHVHKSNFAGLAVRPGKPLLHALARDMAVELVFLEARRDDPEWLYLLSQIRQSPEAGGVPVILLVPRSEDALRIGDLAKPYGPVVLWSPPPMSTGLFQARLNEFRQDRFQPPLSKEERQDYAARAIELVGELARVPHPGLDFTEATQALVGALSSDVLAPAATEALAHLPGPVPQEGLAALLVDSARPPSARVAAARALRSLCQRYGVLLKLATVHQLAQAIEKTQDASLRLELMRLATVLRDMRTGRASPQR